MELRPYVRASHEFLPRRGLFLDIKTHNKIVYKNPSVARRHLPYLYEQRRKSIPPAKNMFLMFLCLKPHTQRIYTSYISCLNKLSFCLLTTRAVPIVRHSPRARSIILSCDYLITTFFTSVSTATMYTPCCKGISLRPACKATLCTIPSIVLIAASCATGLSTTTLWSAA